MEPGCFQAAVDFLSPFRG
jgi:hypothetical protein